MEHHLKYLTTYQILKAPIFIKRIGRLKWPILQIVVAFRNVAKAALGICPILGTFKPHASLLPPISWSGTNPIATHNNMENMKQG